MKGLWLVVGSLLTVFALITATAGMFAGFADARAPSETVSWRTEFDRPSLKIDATAGNIELTVERGPAGRISVEKTLQWWEAKPRTSETWAGQTLKLDTSCESETMGPGCWVHYVVRVPVDTDIDAVTGGGELRVVQLRGELDLRSENGWVVLVDTWSPLVRVRTDRGRVSASGLISDDVSIESVTGSMELDFDKPPARLSAVLQAGDEIEVRVPPGGTYDLSVDALHEIIGVHKVPGVERTMTLSNPHGMVNVCCS